MYIPTIVNFEKLIFSFVCYLSFIFSPLITKILKKKKERKILREPREGVVFAYMIDLHSMCSYSVGQRRETTMLRSNDFWK